MRARLYCVGIVLFAATNMLAAETPIYRCTANGTTVFSDQPCGHDAEPVTLDDSRLSTFTPVPAAKGHVPHRSAPNKRSAPKENRVATSKETKGRCVRIGASIRSIDAQLRAGYTAKQGIRLEERKRNLRQQARELKCR